MSNTFVRKDFYIQPPEKNSAPEEWKKWLEKDKREAIKARREFNKTMIQCDAPEMFQENTVRKVNGVWRSATSVGVVGSVEGGDAHLEPTIDATQERDYDQARFTSRDRGYSQSKAGNQKRKERRLRRAMRRKGMI